VRVPAPARPLAALAAIALAEALALVAYGLLDVVQAVREGAAGPADASNLPAIAVQVVIFTAFGAGMAWVARGWWGARRWARAPFLLGQLMALVVGIPLAQSDGVASRVAGLLLVMAAGIGIVLVFSPQARAAIDG
jgi:hypothetical protein